MEQRAKMHKTVTTENSYERIQKLVIISYSPRPKGPAAAGLGNGFNAAKETFFTLSTQLNSRTHSHRTLWES